MICWPSHGTADANAGDYTARDVMRVVELGRMVLRIGVIFSAKAATSAKNRS